MNKPENPPAFPSEGLVVGKSEDGFTRNFPNLNTGMTLRDYFAGKTLTGYVSDPRITLVPDNCIKIAKSCYLMADAMLAERSKQCKK